MNTRICKTGDVVLVIAIAAMALLLMVWNAYGRTPDQQIIAVIKQDGKLIKQIDLSDIKDSQYIYINEPIRQVIVAENGRIRFLESDCPNQICVKSGWLTRPGDRAVCMPSKVVITIMGGDKQVDSIAY